MPKDTRGKVTLSPEAFKALEVEAMLHGTNLKDTASKLILKAACPKCIEILEIMDRPAKEVTNTQVPNGPITQERQRDKGTKGPMPSERQRARVHDVTMTQVPKKKKLSEDPSALAKLKELCAQSPRPSYAAIGREIGYPKATVCDNIKAMRERGEL